MAEAQGGEAKWGCAAAVGGWSCVAAVDAVTGPARAVRDYIEHWNTDAQPFARTATADEILEKIALTETSICQLVTNNAKENRITRCRYPA